MRNLRIINKPELLSIEQIKVFEFFCKSFKSQNVCIMYMHKHHVLQAVYKRFLHYRYLVGFQSDGRRALLLKSSPIQAIFNKRIDYTKNLVTRINRLFGLAYLALFKPSINKLFKCKENSLHNFQKFFYLCFMVTITGERVLEHLEELAF